MDLLGRALRLLLGNWGLPFVSDAVTFDSWLGIAKFGAWCFAVPLYREVHFYFAHRLIHIKCLYKYVHSTHHRNTDIEPFAGLCMHYNIMRRYASCSVLYS